MKFSVCIDALFRGQDFLEAMGMVKESGLTAYEFWGWWDKDLEAILSRQKELGLSPTAFCTKFYSLVDPSQHEAYIGGLRESIAAAQKLGCHTLISQAGAELPGIPRGQQEQALTDGLRACIPVLEGSGVQLVLEPLNCLDHPGYYLVRSEEAERIVAAVNHPQIRLLFDFYHQQISEGDLIRNSTRMADWIGHAHCAGNPGRHELDVGEIRYEGVFQALENAGYRGYMGLEYTPSREILPELRRMAALEAQGA